MACGKGSIDLKRACEILSERFGVERMAVVGGGHINAGFLAAGLLDEVSLLIGAGIDGRGGMAAVFYGLPMERPVPANVKHWHGAKKDSWFSHIAVEVPGEKCENEWCEPVSEEEYDKL